MRREFLALIVIWMAAGRALSDDHWPSFRNGGTSLASVASPPTRWSPEQGIAWRINLPGYGQSAPVVWGDTVFLTSSEGPWQERGFVHGFDLASGQRRWTTEVPSTAKVENYFRNSRAAPTSVVDAVRNSNV